MTKRELFSMAMKVTGVIFIVLGIIDIPAIIQALSFNITNTQGVSISGVPYKIGTVLYPVIRIIAGYLLIIWSNALANRLVQADGEIAAGNIDIQSLLKAAVAVTGIYFAISGLILLIQTFVQASYPVMHAGGQLSDVFNSSLLAAKWSGFASAIAGIIIGLSLLFGSGYISRFFFKPNTNDSNS